MEYIDYSSVKQKIERENCSKHKKHPKFEKTSKGFEILACCEEFRSDMIKRTKKIMAEETKSAIERMLKNTFK
ncbi:hypothetical protein ESY86_17740 [Subsaximicrobium wynnwilliamsii]|uniref:Uncharacterized protein n=1 Tax=Subsaximicrobium wynnwilliamsii TaxID=291179 RepID=A0A5C6ZBZ9_9FLAO|nr:hypothetical protein [Subsaximicrobium wynnwilliamsii]TXD81491.1 hypothetical protein ESY87_17740 [Subsaximicrobium wynnwilliamsii]TXD87158.1 hypothetical protein ESY86_17740 [Subsaximicrobium wynnwilliamsii]TXE00851.1 hypothetical protein ESY88_17990 [Subsaximicrobium wynnwilliamsii]